MDEMPENQQLGTGGLPPNPFQPQENDRDDSPTPPDSPNRQFHNENETFLKNGQGNAFTGMEVAQDIIDEVLDRSTQDPDASTMAIHGTPANKATASRSYSDESLSDPDSDDGGGEGSGTRDAAPKPNTMAVRISGAPVAYTKAWYIGLSKRPGWVPFFYIERRGEHSLVHVLPEEIFCRWNCAIGKTDPNAEDTVCAREIKFANGRGGLIKHIESHFPKNGGYLIRSVKPGGRKELELDNLRTAWETLCKAIKTKQELDVVCPVGEAVRKAGIYDVFPTILQPSTAKGRGKRRATSADLQDQTVTQVKFRSRIPMKKDGKPDRDAMFKLLGKTKKQKCVSCTSNKKTCLSDWDTCVWFNKNFVSPNVALPDIMDDLEDDEPYDTIAHYNRWLE